MSPPPTGKPGLQRHSGRVGTMVRIRPKSDLWTDAALPIQARNSCEMRRMSPTNRHNGVQEIGRPAEPSGGWVHAPPAQPRLQGRPVRDTRIRFSSHWVLPRDQWSLRLILCSAGMATTGARQNRTPGGIPESDPGESPGPRAGPEEGIPVRIVAVENTPDVAGRPREYGVSLRHTRVPNRTLSN